MGLLHFQQSALLWLSPSGGYPRRRKNDIYQKTSAIQFFCEIRAKSPFHRISTYRAKSKITAFLTKLQKFPDLVLTIKNICVMIIKSEVCPHFWKRKFSEATNRITVRFCRKRAKGNEILNDEVIF